MATPEEDEPRLLPGEKVVMTSGDGNLTLTNLRVRIDETGRGESRYLSVTLDAIASCGVVTKTSPAILGLAAVAAIIGVVQGDSDVRLALLGLGAILVVVYVTTRSAMLTISSMGGETIAVPAKGIGRKGIVEFIDAVDAAKIEFLGRSAKT